MSNEKNRNCKSCGKIISEPSKQYCFECRVTPYKEKTHYEHICSKCNGSFRGTQKQKICSYCKDNLPFRVYEDIEREVLCPVCNCVKHTENVKYLKNLTKEVRISGIVCNNCSIEKKKNSYATIVRDVMCKSCGKKIGTESVKKRHNTRDVGYEKCPTCIQKGKNEIKQRMKTNNPMFDSDTKQKGIETAKRRRQSGEIKSKVGRDHANYKGNKTLYVNTRVALKYWIKDVLSRDDYTCQRCFVRGDHLHVHHLKKFINIYNEVVFMTHGLAKGIVIKSDHPLHDTLLNEIVEAHKIEYGITVCRECHEIIDYRYRRTKNESKNREDCEREEQSLQLSLSAK